MIEEFIMFASVIFTFCIVSVGVIISLFNAYKKLKEFIKKRSEE